MTHRSYTVRPARLDDARFVYQLSMDPRIRAASTRSDEFSYESHVEWFQHKLDNTHAHRTWILEVAAAPIGQVRYGKVVPSQPLWTGGPTTRERRQRKWTGAEAEIAIAVNPPEWGKGWGKALLEETMALARADLQLERLVALVVEGNHRSGRLFESLGFRAVGVEGRMGKAHTRYEHVR